MLNEKFEWVNNKYLMVIFLFIVFFLAFDLRVYKLSKVFSEYDDSFVHSLHKGVLDDREIGISLGKFEKKFNLKKELIFDLEHSFLLYPLYISYSSAFPPGQYVLLPIILSKNDNFDETIFKSRIVSVLFSLLTLCVLFYLFFKIDKKVNWTSIFICSLFAFSVNSIMYSHHAGVYSSSGFATAVSIFLVYLVIKNKLSIYSANIFNTILLYFSYLGILFYLPILFASIQNNKFSKILKEYLYYKKKYLITNILLGLPYLIQFIIAEYPHNYRRGKMSPSISEPINLILNYVNQFYLSSKSLLSGLIPYTSFVFFLFLFIFGITAVFIYLNKTKKDSKKILIYCCLIYLFQWAILYCFNIIPLDQTRHSLIFFPVILVILYISFEYLKILNVFYFLILIILIPFSYVTTYKVIDSRVSIFDYEFLNKQKEKHILLYDSLHPMTYYEKTDKKVYYIQLQQFKDIYNSLEIPDEFLVVGHHSSIDEWKTTFKNHFPNIYINHKITALIEKNTNKNYLYNNYDLYQNSPNGFYVYRFEKIN